MSSEVIVDGVKYVPSNEQIEIISSILKDVGYLSDKAIEEIIAKFKDFETEKPKKPEKAKWKRSKVNIGNLDKTVYEPVGVERSLFNIKNVSKKGIVEYKNGRVSTAWKMQDADYINKHISNDSTYQDINDMAKLLSLKRPMVGKIIYNLRNGDLPDWIAKWKGMNTPVLKPKKPTPIVNNPQRRKEMGFGGIP